MNDRIKELLKQATTTHYSGMGERDEVDQEKFAELIVRECASICDNDYVRCGQDGAGWKLAREIEEHFGVE